MIQSFLELCKSVRPSFSFQWNSSQILPFCVTLKPSYMKEHYLFEEFIDKLFAVTCTPVQRLAYNTRDVIWKNDLPMEPICKASVDHILEIVDIIDRVRIPQYPETWKFNAKYRKNNQSSPFLSVTSGISCDSIPVLLPLAEKFRGGELLQEQGSARAGSEHGHGWACGLCRSLEQKEADLQVPPWRRSDQRKDLAVSRTTQWHEHTHGEIQAQVAGVRRDHLCARHRPRHTQSSGRR